MPWAPQATQDSRKQWIQGDLRRGQETESNLDVYVKNPHFRTSSCFFAGYFNEDGGHSLVSIEARAL